MKSRDSDNDAELFDQAMGDVKRLHHKLAATKPVRHSKMIATTASPEVTSDFGEELRFLRPGTQTATLQKLRRGRFPNEATLDLHGLTATEATVRIQHFIQQSQSMGRSAVRIVHGKGYGSAGRQPVLKTKVRQLLEKSHAVLAFCSARQQDGGTGAVDVLLRKSKSVR